MTSKAEEGSLAVGGDVEGSLLANNSQINIINVHLVSHATQQSGEFTNQVISAIGFEKLSELVEQNATFAGFFNRVRLGAALCDPKKLKYFSNLAFCGVTEISKEQAKVSELDEYLSIITELSCREIWVLSLIEKFGFKSGLDSNNTDANEKAIKIAIEENKKMRSKLTEKTEDTVDSIDSILERLKSRGLYFEKYDLNPTSTLGGSNNLVVHDFRLTSLYNKLKEVALQEVVSKYPS